MERTNKGWMQAAKASEQTQIRDARRTLTHVHNAASQPPTPSWARARNVNAPCHRLPAPTCSSRDARCVVGHEVVLLSRVRCSCPECARKCGSVGKREQTAPPPAKITHGKITTLLPVANLQLTRVNCKTKGIVKLRDYRGHSHSRNRFAFFEVTISLSRVADGAA